MTYQALARKWRPRVFEELVGQEHVVQALCNALEKQRLHHAYLLTGTRGVGKTTIARILAKSLNCETGITARPCGECRACREIDAGRFVDLLELDAASHTGIDNMREILDNARYAPTSGRYKVYLIDEVHMLSKAAFNSMLKTLEEPPEHVKFVLATTDPQKIPVTVLSRCLQFNLKQLPAPLIRDRLLKVLEAEGIEFEPEALSLMARAARGSMRDALSLLDQAIAYAGGKVETAVTRAMLGAVDTEHVFRLLEAWRAGDGAALLQEAGAMAQRNLSFDAALQEMAAVLQQAAVLQAIPDALDPNDLDLPALRRLAAETPAEDLQLAYQIALLGREDLPLAPDEYAGFCMTLLRLLAFRPEPTAGAASGGKLPSGATSSRVAVPAATPVTAAAPTATSTSSSAAKAQFDGDWAALALRLPVNGMAQQLALNSEIAGWDGTRLVLRVAEAQRHLTEKAYQDKLRAALEQALGGRLQLAVEIGAGLEDTAALRERREKAEQLARAREEFAADPFVKDVVGQLGGRIREDSVRPTN